jgi:hypothetical protein
MEKLNYDMLKKLTRTKRSHLEIVDIDARRLRDDTTEIRSGDEVAFVATAKVRLTRDGLAHVRSEVPECKPLIKEMAEGDDLLEIGSDAEVVSELPIDPDGVKKWLTEHYAFTFLLDGEGSEHFRTIGRSDITYPWVRTLNTGIVRNDHFDVAVQIDEMTPPPLPVPPPGLPPGRIKIAATAVDVELDDASLELMVAIEAPFRKAHELQGKTFWIPLHPEEDNVRLVVTVSRATAKTSDEVATPAKHKLQDRNR